MKIEQKEPLRRLDKGDYFMYKGELFIVKSGFLDLDKAGAVRLNDGEAFFFHNDTWVTPKPDARVVVD